MRLGIGLGLSGQRGASGPSLNLSATSILESAVSGSTVGVLSVVNHPSGSSGWTFAETADPDNKFTVSGSNLNTSASLNYEAATSHSVTITASKSGQTDIVRVFPITVTNVLEVTLNAITGTFTLAENASAGAVAGAYSGKTSGSTLTLSDDAGGRVAISGGNVVRGATALDYETATSHSFTFYETHPDAAPRSTTVSLTVTDIDEVAPTLSSPADAANGATGATISVSTNEGNGTLYWYISTSATPPSASALKAGTGAAAAGSQSVSGTGAQNASPTGLTALTAYYTYFLHRDTAGNDSTIAAADGFTTDEASTVYTKLLAVGDSITATDNSSPWNAIGEAVQPRSYARLYGAERPWLTFTVDAVGGSALGSPGDTSPTNSLYARLSTDLATDCEVVTVLTGANDFGNDTSNYLSRVLAYAANFRSAGKKVAVGTVLTRTGVSGWDSARSTFNAGLRAQVGSGIDAVIDFDTCAAGVDGNASDTALFPDGLHPSFAVQQQMKTVYAAAIDTLMGITRDTHVAPLLARLSVAPSDARKALIGDFIVGLKADNVWNEIRALWLPGVFGNATDALLNIISTSHTMAGVNSPTFTADRGFQGNGSTSLLNTNIAPVDIYQDSMSFGAWVNGGTDSAADSFVMGSAHWGGGWSYIYPRSADGNLRGLANGPDSGTFAYGTATSAYGLSVLERSSSTITKAYKNGTVLANTRSGGGADNSFNFALLGFNGGGTFGWSTDFRTPAAFVGRGMGATKQAALYARLNTLLTAIGAN